MGSRELALAAALATLAACASTQGPPKPYELPAPQRAGVSGAFEPLLTAAKLWRGPDDGCPAAYQVVEADVIGAAVTPHAPCRVRLVLTQVTVTTLDPATLRALLAHEIAHMQLSHPEARQARADAQKATEKNIKTASSAASKAVELHPWRRRLGVEGDRHGAEGRHHGDGDAGHAATCPRRRRPRTPWPPRS